MQTLQTACKCRRLPYMARRNGVAMPQKEMPIISDRQAMFELSAIGIVAAVVMLVVLFV